LFTQLIFPQITLQDVISVVNQQCQSTEGLIIVHRRCTHYLLLKSMLISVVKI